MEELSIVDDYQDIRDGVIALCANFPGEYWQKLDAESEYADEFVAELTASGLIRCRGPCWPLWLFSHC